MRTGVGRFWPGRRRRRGGELPLPVGCDGAHSTMRAILGLDFPDGQFPQTFELSDLDVDRDLPRSRAY